jgi:hypothetical protein
MLVLWVGRWSEKPLFLIFCSVTFQEAYNGARSLLGSRFGAGKLIYATKCFNKMKFNK